MYWFDILLQINGTKQEKWHTGSDLLSSYWECTNKLATVTKISAIVDSLSCCSGNLLHSASFTAGGRVNKHVKVTALCCVFSPCQNLLTGWTFSIKSSSSELASRWETSVQSAVLFLQIQETKKANVRSECFMSPPAGKRDTFALSVRKIQNWRS